MHCVSADTFPYAVASLEIYICQCACARNDTVLIHVFILDSCLSSHADFYTLSCQVKAYILNLFLIVVVYESYCNSSYKRVNAVVSCYSLHLSPDEGGYA